VRRRQFITLIGSAAAWPLVARAQQTAKLPTIGVFGVDTAVVWSPWVAALIQRLRELGWIEGRTIAIEYRWADGRRERFEEIAAEFVRLKVDIIVTGQSTIPALKQLTSVIPIVLAISTDPIGTGTVASLAHPGGNITGLSLQATDLVGKRLELLREVVPAMRRLAILANIGYPAACWKWTNLRLQPKQLGSMLRGSKFAVQRISARQSRRTRTVWMRFTSRPMRL
jgi:putative tryptophan/tyrosine transport system substrate-binding protein